MICDVAFRLDTYRANLGTSLQGNAHTGANAFRPLREKSTRYPKGQLAKNEQRYRRHCHES